jgi:hypothetical protein
MMGIFFTNAREEDGQRQQKSRANHKDCTTLRTISIVLLMLGKKETE